MITVRSIPAGHPYAECALPGPGRGVNVASDPVLDPRWPERWWPHPAWDPEWVDPDSPDLVHVHFGYEHLAPEGVRAACAAWSRRRVPLVVTVHDLVNPHEERPVEHLRRTQVLVEAADAVLTLTAGAAEQVRALWSRAATVVAHPPLVPPEHAARHRRRDPGRTPVVGVHLQSRANVDVPTTVAAVELLLATVPRVRVRLSVAQGIDTGGIDATTWRRVCADPRVQVTARMHEPDAALFARLSGVDVQVLPYRRGSHSGWIELCRDLGVSLVVPDCGHYVEQAGGLTHAAYRVGDPVDLARAVADTLDRPRPTPESAAVARRRLRYCTLVHAELYAGLVAGEGRP